MQNRTLNINIIFSFSCRGFSFTAPLSQGDTNTCLLTDQDLDTLER